MLNDAVAQKLNLSTDRTEELKRSCANFLINHSNPESVIKLILTEDWVEKEKLFITFYFGTLIEYLEADPFVQLILSFKNKFSNEQDKVYTDSIGKMNRILDVENIRGLKVFAQCIVFIRQANCKSEVIKNIFNTDWTFTEKILGCFCSGRLFGFIENNPDKVKHIKGLV